MNIQLPADVTRSIESLLATGRYTSREEVLRTALEALRRRDEDLQAIAAGIDDMEQGRYRAFSEVDTEFRQRHGIPRPK